MASRPPPFTDQKNNRFTFFGATLGQDLRDSYATTATNDAGTSSAQSQTTSTKGNGDPSTTPPDADNNGQSDQHNNPRLDQRGIEHSRSSLFPFAQESGTYYDLTTRNPPGTLFRDYNVPIMGLAHDAVWNSTPFGTTQRRSSAPSHIEFQGSNPRINESNDAFSTTTQGTSAAGTNPTAKKSNEFGAARSLASSLWDTPSFHEVKNKKGIGINKTRPQDFSDFPNEKYGIDVPDTPVKRNIFDSVEEGSQSNTYQNNTMGRLNSGDIGDDNVQSQIGSSENTITNNGIISNDTSTSTKSSINDPEVDQITQKMSEVWDWFQKQARHYEYKNDQPEGSLFKNSPLILEHTAAAEKLCAREMFEMNVNEREAISNEIHGVGNRSVEESPALVASALSALREEIDQHLDKEVLDQGGRASLLFTKDAHKWGISNLQSVYIQSDEFRIRFLRKAFFDIQDAAMHYFRYLDLIYDFFGDEALLRPLYLTDLTQREIEYFKRGQQQLFPSRDRSGRRIYAFVGCNNTKYTLQEKYRVMTYLFDVMAQDETTQKLGLVMLAMIQRSGKVDAGGDANPRFFRRAQLACPVRCSAFHLCFPERLASHLVQAIVVFFIEKKLRSIMRYHHGSTIENSYHLCGYGIPPADVPMTPSGKVKSKNVTTFLNAREIIETVQKEQVEKCAHNPSTCGRNRNSQREGTPGSSPFGSSSSNTCVCTRCFRITVHSVVECPDLHCVIFGDKKMFDHHGNFHFRKFLRDMEQKRSERIQNFDETVTSVANFVDDSIKEAKTRFRFYSYKRTQSLYKELTDADELHRRVHLLLRDLRKRSRVAEVMSSGEKPHGDASSTATTHKTNDDDDAQELQQADGSSILGRNISHKRTKTSREDSSPSYVLGVNPIQREGFRPFCTR